MFTFGSLFAGIGGFDLGLERAGMICQWQVEIDPCSRSVLQSNWPKTPRYKDVQDVGVRNLEAVDLICGGFPCQDVSLAGRRAGLKGKRSTLWSEFHRIIGEIGPRWVLVENVRGLYTSDSGRFFGKILRDLAESRYDAEWDCLSAAFFGAPQLRHRIFIVAYPKGHFGRSAGLPHVFTQDQSDMADNRRPSSKVAWNGIWIDRKDETTYTHGFPEPIFHRLADGVSNRVDKEEASSRMKQVGNAIVPQAAEWLGRRIIEADARWTEAS